MDSDHLKRLTLSRIDHLTKLLKRNHKKFGRTFLMPCDLFPGVADDYGYYSVDYAESALRKMGDVLRRFKKNPIWRLPPDVAGLFLAEYEVERNACVRYLRHLVDVMDKMRCGADAVVVIQLYDVESYPLKPVPSKETLIATCHELLNKLPINLRNRVALTNDRFMFPLPASPIVNICRENNVRFVPNFIPEQAGTLLEMRTQLRKLWKCKHVKPTVLGDECMSYDAALTKMYDVAEKIPFLRRWPDEGCKTYTTSFTEGKKVLMQIP